MKLRQYPLAACIALIGMGLYGQQSNFEGEARDWIVKNSQELGLKPHHDVHFTFVHKGPSGETLRFQQMINGVPVFQSEVVVHFNVKGKITHTSESLSKNAANISVIPSISEDVAFQKASQAFHLQGEIMSQEAKLYVWDSEEFGTKLVYRVLMSSFETPGEWEAMIDAQNGNVLRVQDIAIYYGGHKHKHSHFENGDPEEAETSIMETGTAYIYNPDPLSATGSAYGGQYVDGNDATNSALDAARSLVTIPELTYSGGQYRLKSQYVEIRDLEAPSTGLFSQASPDFLFNRSEQGFEAINAFWHIDNNLRYINETLGIHCVSLYNGGKVHFDPHGLNGQDNSYYSSGRLVFGEGCVDDAEDADVIIHELGHGVHHWITNGNLSQVNGLSEGSGDYWAQSYSRSLNQWQPTQPAYHWVFNWDGHNPCWGGRTTNYGANYPGGLTGAIHTDGQIWSTAMMRVWNRIGKTKTDAAFLEGLAMTNSSTNQQNAAIAVRQAALDLVEAGMYGFTCADVEAMTEELSSKGYNLPEYECEEMGVSEVLGGKIASIYPNPTSDKLNIMMDFKKSETVVVFDMAGKKVMESTINANKNFIHVGHLPKGVYVIMIKGTTFTQKFVKE